MACDTHNSNLLFSTDVGLPNVKKLLVSLVDSKPHTLDFELEVIRKFGDQPPTDIKVRVSVEQVDIIMRLAGMPHNPSR